MAEKQVDSNIFNRGYRSPLEAGEFNLSQLSLHSPSNPNAVLLDSPTSFIELNIFEDLFSNVLKGTYVFVDTQGLVETLPIIGDATLVLAYSTPRGEGTKTSTDSVINRESRTQAEETYKQRFKVYDIQEVRTQERANFYKLFFISEEYVFSSKMKVSKGYK